MTLGRWAKSVLTVLLLVALMLPYAAQPAEAAATVKMYRVTGAGVRLRSEAHSNEGSEVLASLKKGQIVMLLKNNRNWYYVALENGVKGWVYNGFLKYYGAANKNMVGYCTGTSVSVRKRADTDSKKIGTLKKNQVIIVKRYNETWAEIQSFSGKSGYVLIKYLKQAF